ncbi:MAG TPA: 5-formyltetrahydrofolate cyclo-ligase [Gammaproteobacteria bacterium]|nr:5-formyltetrahydrofolate cyclo-ligase [Gammaproteobacteria bacterium]
MPSRSDQRKQLRARRNALSESERLVRSTTLCKQLARQPVFRNSRRIAAYLPADGEVETAPLIALAWRMGKQVYLPVLVPYRANRLWFARYEPDTPLIKNRFGIAEPANVHRQRIAAQALDLVLAPLVGFDHNGHRLGMGGGFYDRSFAYLLHRQHWRKPRLVGLAYDFQQLPRLSAKPWDVPLTAVATDSNWHLFRKG